MYTFLELKALQALSCMKLKKAMSCTDLQFLRQLPGNSQIIHFYFLSSFLSFFPLLKTKRESFFRPHFLQLSKYHFSCFNNCSNKKFISFLCKIFVFTASWESKAHHGLFSIGRKALKDLIFSRLWLFHKCCSFYIFASFRSVLNCWKWKVLSNT